MGAGSPIPETEWRSGSRTFEKHAPYARIEMTDASQLQFGISLSYLLLVLILLLNQVVVLNEGIRYFIIKKGKSEDNREY